MPVRPVDDPLPAPAAQMAPVAAERTQTAAPVREITIRVPQPNEAKVDLHVVERAGKIVVDVRTQSPELSQTLRTHVNELVSNLEAKGFHSQPSTPPATASALTDAARQVNTEIATSNSGADSDPQQGRQQPQQPEDQRQQQRRAQQAWVDYFDQTLEGEYDVR